MFRLKIAAIALLSASSLFAVETPIATILSYHEVVPGGVPPFKTHPPPGFPDVPTEADRYTLDTKDFTAQLDFLDQNGYHVVPLADLVDYLKGSRADLPPRPVVITVDDGYLSTYKEIFPLMRERKLPFTFFIYPQIVNVGKNYVTWAQVMEMADAGVDIESHTFTHALLTLQMHKDFTAEDYAQFLRHELLDSKTLIEAKTGKPVRFIAYPYSNVDFAVQRAARQYGYEGALYDQMTKAFIKPSTSPMSLVRFPILHDTSLDQFKAALP